MQLLQISDDGVRQHLTELVLSPSTRSRWTLLTGHFGTGKTTTGLHATKLAAHDVIYVRGDDLIHTSGGYGTNAMLGRIADALALFDDYGDETRLFLQRVAGRTIAEFLRSNDGANITLFIDALDESRGYGAPEGVWKLINQIADLTCPIVLTTRREHFDSTFRNLSQALKSDELPRAEVHLEMVGSLTSSYGKRKRSTSLSTLLSGLLTRTRPIICVASWIPLRPDKQSATTGTFQVTRFFFR